MTTSPSAVAAAPAGLSQIERVVDTLIAPSKTFKDILRSASWWLPLLLMLLSTVASAWVIDRQVGFDRVYENSLQENAQAQDRLNSLEPAQKARAMEQGALVTKYSSYGFGILLLFFTTIYSLIVWGVFNFGLGATTRFSQVFAVSLYAMLPYLFLTVLLYLTLYLGGSAEAFDSKNPVGTNLAYYLPSLSPALKVLLGSFDVVKLWSLFLMTLGMSIVAKKSMLASFVVIGGFWLLTVAATVGAVAAFS